MKNEDKLKIEAFDSLMAKYELGRIITVDILKARQKEEERKGIMMSKEYKNIMGI